MKLKEDFGLRAFLILLVALTPSCRGKETAQVAEFSDQAQTLPSANCARISESEKLNRDILLYWLWQEGKYTNLQIGNLFGLTHSSVSRRVTIIMKKMPLEQDFQRQVDAIKSQIKP